MIPSFSDPPTLPARSPTPPRSRSRFPGFAAAALAGALLLAPEQASAQEAPAVSPDGKGIVGGALLGAEVVDLTLGIVGVNAGWPYLVFGAVGAAGGGVGGYFVEQETRDVPEVALYMLAGGMALVIPTIVVSLNATMYKPPEGTITNEPADNQPAIGPTPTQGPLPTQPLSRRRAPAPAPAAARHGFSLVGLRGGEMAFSLPAVEVKPLYSRREMWQYGVEQGTEVRVPLFQASF